MLQLNASAMTLRETGLSNKAFDMICLAYRVQRGCSLCLLLLRMHTDAAAGHVDENLDNVIRSAGQHKSE
eukprot:2698928-Amphidinium_carterae.1